MKKIVVKILTGDAPTFQKGEVYENTKWCYVQNWSDGPRSLCRGEVFGEGESSCKFKTKPLKKGAVTCPRCLEIFKEIVSASERNGN